VSAPPLSAKALATLRAVVDRLIPRDDFPGATDAGVDVYILRQLAGDLASERTLVASGLDAIETAARNGHGDPFASLSPDEQDALLERVAGATATASFFNRLVELTAEGFYADPGQGGNRDEVSWRMIGYARRGPGNPSAT